jgi:hypothetical protein
MTNNQSYAPRLVAFLLGAALTMAVSACNTEPPQPPQKTATTETPVSPAEHNANAPESDVLAKP